MGNPSRAERFRLALTTWNPHHRCFLLVWRTADSPPPFRGKNRGLHAYVFTDYAENIQRNSGKEDKFFEISSMACRRPAWSSDPGSVENNPSCGDRSPGRSVKVWPRPGGDRQGRPGRGRGPRPGVSGGLVARLASRATTLKSLFLATDGVGYAGHVARQHAQSDAR